MNSTTLEIKSFKQAHAELQLDIDLIELSTPTDSAQKSNFLEKVGFKNAPITLIHKVIGDTEKSKKIKEYKIHYPQYKFIVDTQLERLCTKYNLFIRDPEFYCGDIPEFAINEMQKFSLRFIDVFSVEELTKFFVYHCLAQSETDLERIWNTLGFPVLNPRLYQIFDNIEERYSELLDGTTSVIFSSENLGSKDHLHEIEIMYPFKDYKSSNHIKDVNLYNKNLAIFNALSYILSSSKKQVSLTELMYLRIPMDELKFYGISIKIASVKSLFSSQAFETNQERIVPDSLMAMPVKTRTMTEEDHLLKIKLEKEHLERQKAVELQAQAQLDNDPVVLVKVLHGFLVPTIWGDESSDKTFAKNNAFKN